MERFENRTCPHCGGHEVEGYDVIVDDGFCSQEKACRLCGARWSDMYRFDCYSVVDTSGCDKPVSAADAQRMFNEYVGSLLDSRAITTEERDRLTELFVEFGVKVNEAAGKRFEQERKLDAAEVWKPPCRANPDWSDAGGAGSPVTGIAATWTDDDVLTPKESKVTAPSYSRRYVYGIGTCPTWVSR